MQNGSDRNVKAPEQVATWKSFAGEMVVPVLLAGYATHYYLSVTRMPRPETNLLLIEPVYWILVGCCLLFFGSRLIQVLRPGAGADLESASLGKGSVPLVRALSFVVLTGGYIWLIPILGFVSATMCYTLLMLLGLGIRSLLILVLTPLSLAILLWLAMEYFLGIPLPAGLLR